MRPSPQGYSSVEYSPKTHDVAFAADLLMCTNWVERDHDSLRIPCRSERLRQALHYFCMDASTGTIPMSLLFPKFFEQLPISGIWWQARDNRRCAQRKIDLRSGAVPNLGELDVLNSAKFPPAPLSN